MQVLLTAALTATLMFGALTPELPHHGSLPPALQQEVPAVPVDLNQATAEKLQEIPGIGPAMAERIVEWRREHGPFEKVEDLLNIRGIGEKTLEKLRPFVKIEDAGSAGSAVARCWNCSWCSGWRPRCWARSHPSGCGGASHTVSAPPRAPSQLTAGALRTRAAVQGTGYGLRFEVGRDSLTWECGARRQRERHTHGGDPARHGRNDRCARGTGPAVSRATSRAARRSGGTHRRGARGRSDPGTVNDILSLRPEGSATAGTIYMHDGFGAAAAIVIYGPTGRITVWRYHASPGPLGGTVAALQRLC